MRLNKLEIEGLPKPGRILDKAFDNFR